MMIVYQKTFEKMQKRAGRPHRRAFAFPRGEKSHDRDEISGPFMTSPDFYIIGAIPGLSCAVHAKSRLQTSNF